MFSRKLRTRRTRHGFTGALAVAALVGLSSAASADAATFTVTNELDSGAGSLRQAIVDANTTGGRDEIVFSIPNLGNPNWRHVIPLASDLDPITEEVEIDGYTQPGSVEAVTGTPALIKIVIGAPQASNGLVLQADDSVVRGLVVRNAGTDVPDAAGVGIRVEGDRNRLEGNYVGLDGTSNNDFGWGNAGDGVEILGNDNVVGGSGPEHANVITANGKLTSTEADGVSIDGDGNEVRGNVIGTNPETDNDQIGNSDTGVRIAGDDNSIDANVISGNKTAIEVDRGSGNDVLGNLVGTDATGTVALGNGSGVVLHGSGNRVGDSGAEEANTIASTLTAPGIEVRSHDNVIEGNRVGTDVTGALAMPNQGGGILVTGDRNWIGGEFDGQANLVSGNADYGIRLAGRSFDRPDRSTSADDNVVVGNLVGTDVSGSGPLGNEAEGIGVALGNDNTIGAAAAPNVVAFNGEDGVRIESGARNSSVGNSIFENGGLGINLGVDGVTVNDKLDRDTGANGLLNFPRIDSATTTDGETEITWRIDSGQPNTPLRIDFYANDACDPTQHGEAQRLIHSTTVTTNAQGYVSAVTPVGTDETGQQVTATASTYSSVGWPLNDMDTSELSACRAVSAP
jgi:hypothetical protein